MQKRTLDLRTGDDVISEIRRLAADGYDRAGNWSLTQICDHVEKAITGTMKGIGFRAPWIFRVTLGQWFVNSALRNNRAPNIKIPAPKPFVPTAAPSPTDDPAVIERCIAAIEEAKAFPGPMKDYPIVNEISVDDWRRMMWIHAAHHLAFLIPRTK